MSDLAATGCGCGCDDGCSGRSSDLFGGGNSCILWILVLLSCCGNGSGLGRSGSSCGGCSGGCGDNSCILIIILLLCCSGSFGC